MLVITRGAGVDVGNFMQSMVVKYDKIFVADSSRGLLGDDSNIYLDILKYQSVLSLLLFDNNAS